MSSSHPISGLAVKAWSLIAVRYLAVGGLSFWVDFGVFMGLTEVGMSVPMAQLFARSIGAVISFVGHKYVSFRSDSQATRASHQALMFGAWFLVSLVVSVVIVTGMVWLLGGWRAGGKAAAEAIIVFMNFVAARFIFRPSPEPDPVT